MFVSRILRLVLVSLLVSSSLALAAVASDDCTYRNLYELPNDPLADIPIYEQGETDLCYAYTAAQLTEYYLRKNETWTGDAHLNPLWIAIAYKGGHSRGIRIKNNELGHGFFHTAFNDMADLGICDPKVFEQSLAEYKGASVLTDPDFFFLYEQMWDQRARHDNFFTKTPQEYEAAMKKLEARPDFQRIRDRAFAHTLDSTLGSLGGSSKGTRVDGKPDGGLFPDPAKVLNAKFLFERELRRIHRIVKEVPEKWVAKAKKIKYLRNAVFGACRGDALWKPDFPETKSLGLGWASNAKLKRGIDSMLDAVVPQPVGIGYCAKIYEDDDAEAARAAKRSWLLPRAAKVLDNAKCSAHYSMIVGRRRAESGKCQYLVRNTYGRDYWTKRYECLCEKAGGSGFEACHYDAKDSPTSNRVVGCWIDETPILNSLYDVSVLKKDELAPGSRFMRR